MGKLRSNFCAKCQTLKATLRNGASKCASCSNAWGRIYYQQGPMRRSKMRRSYVLLRYGLASEEELILARQQGRCAICRRHWKSCVPAKAPRHEVTFLHHLCVDHDHRTGVVRGLLCNACNTAIGLFEQRQERFSPAVAYLSRLPDRV